MRKQARGLVLGGMAVTLALSGCGGGGSKPKLDREELRSRGNALCKAAQDRIDAGAANIFTERSAGGFVSIPTPQEITRFVKEVFSREFDRELDGLDKLGRPIRDPDLYDRALDQGHKGLEQVKNDPTSIQSRDQSPLLPYDDRIGGLGLDECRAGARAIELTNGLRRPGTP